MRALALAAVALAACKQDARAPAPVADGPRCYTLDPGQPPNPAGDVTAVRVRFAHGGVALDSAWDSHGRHGTTHLELVPRGDHLASTDPNDPVTARLDGPPDAPTRMVIGQHDGTYDYDEITDYDARGFTITDDDPAPDGGRVETHKRYSLVPCAQVERALSR